MIGAYRPKADIDTAAQGANCCGSWTSPNAKLSIDFIFGSTGFDDAGPKVLTRTSQD